MLLSEGNLADISSRIFPGTSSGHPFASQIGQAGIDYSIDYSMILPFFMNHLLIVDLPRV
jgi:hypothetical protein